MKDAKVRLYVDQPLGAGQSVVLSREHAHYLFTVMRLPLGGSVLVFDGVSGEWRAEIVVAQKKKGALQCIEQTSPQRTPPDLWLLFAPIKKARTDFIVEKATELGAARLVPVKTEFTNSERIRLDRLQAHAVEAAEQCGGTFVPPIANVIKLKELLANWPADRKMLFCDETLVSDPSSGEKYLGGFAKRMGAKPPPTAILIGPEGGFSDRERAELRGMATSISLGPRILRADTAAVSALTLWQARYGDWA
ncbi:MAG: 16S rRNA (uracil(1498)-N(3))-methyltransferase [Pseudomonadota bacterium]